MPSTTSPLSPTWRVHPPSLCTPRLPKAQSLHGPRHPFSFPALLPGLSASWRRLPLFLLFLGRLLEYLGQLSGLKEGGHDVTPPDELPSHEELRHCRPLPERRKRNGQVRSKDVKGCE